MPEALRSQIRRSAWLFVPALYFTQALPVTLVQDTSSILYKDLGVSNQTILQWTAIISLPWGLQFMLGPLVDLVGTKRGWAMNGQLLILLGVIVAALLLFSPQAFTPTIIALGIIAVASALCNIASDGLYLLSLSPTDQSKFVGIQSTCYRLGAMFTAGALVFFAGKLMAGGQAPRQAWFFVLAVFVVIYGSLHLIQRQTLPRVEDEERGTDRLELRRNILRSLLFVTVGLSVYFALNALVRLSAHGLAISLHELPLLGDLKNWRLEDAQANYAGFGDFPALAAEWGQLLICSLLSVFALLPAIKLTRGSEMSRAITTFVAQPKIGWILAFITLYRLSEAMVGKLRPLFYKDAFSAGGLALSDETIGLVKGIYGVVGIIMGGIVGGYVLSNVGLKRALFPMAVLMHLPNLLYLWASTHHPTMFQLIGIEVTDQFGYGFGFAAYYAYLFSVARKGEYATSHFAIASGLGALCIALAGIIGGIMQKNFGYHGAFVAVIFCTLPGTLTLFKIPIESPA